MKGEITYRILKFIEDGVFMNLNFLEAVAVSGYGASYKKLEFEEQRIARKRKSLVDSFYLPEEEKPKIKRKLSKLLYKLKKDHLISLNKAENKLHLTIKGRKYFGNLGARLNSSFPIAKGYEKEKDNVLKIIAFDIPEAENTKRHWLCSVLKNLGFKMLQKSVWVGRNKFPEAFTGDLSRLGLLNYVEIFEVIKRGTMDETGD